jgi:hypothetical protein
MTNNTLPIDESVDLIDNKLESISFFPFRFICFIGTFMTMYATIIISHNIIEFIIGGLFSIMLVLLAIAQKRITVDLTNSQYKEYLNFYVFKIDNKWNSFKGFRIITITHSDKMLQMNSKYGGAEVTSNNNSVFYLNLKKDNFNKINIAAGSYKEIFTKALRLSHRFEMDILDCSDKPNRKLDYDFISKNYPNHSL